MIIDRLSQASLYYPVSDRLAKAFRYLQETDLLSLSSGKHEIEGNVVYASVSEFTTKAIEEGTWEAHRKYIDIHYVIEGIEQIGYASIDDLSAGPYDEEKDFFALEGEGTFYTLKPGDFVVMFPRDAHMPGIAYDDRLYIKKVVMKVLNFQ